MRAGTRAELALAEARRRLRPAPVYGARYGGGRVFLSHEDFETDWRTLAYVLVDEAYAGDYAGAVVLDLGAHKGYFGAYALARGARAVVSYEPARANLALLQRAAASFRARGADWRVRASVVGAQAGEADLHLLRGSWGHSLAPPEAFAEYEVGVERVPVEALADVLEEGRALAAGARLVVKMNVEGAECEAVLETPPHAWAGVGEAYVETHAWASCGAGELTAHLAAAGLTPAPSAHRAVLRLRRR